MNTQYPNGAPPRASAYIRRLFDRYADPGRSDVICISALPKKEKRRLWVYLQRYRPQIARRLEELPHMAAYRALAERCQGQIVLTRHELLD